MRASPAPNPTCRPARWPLLMGLLAMAWIFPGCFRSRMLNPPKVCPPDNPACNEPGQGDASADGRRDGGAAARRDGPLDGPRDGALDGKLDGGADRGPSGPEVAANDPLPGKLDGVLDGRLDGRVDGPADGKRDAYVCATFESCGNGADDDCNGLADCKDPACMSDPLCIDRKKETCDNGKDDDGNGLADCKDPACFGDQACAKPGVEICNNYLDDDGDKLIDCADSDCAKDPTCVVNPGDEICDNGKDDNGDKLVDCTDPKCKTFPACLRSACVPDVDFGAIASSGASVTRTMSTVGATASFATCAAPGGGARVGGFSLAAAADVKLDFSQPAGAAHVVALFLAGVGQTCDQNPRGCLNVGAKASDTTTYTALPPGSYWLVVQSFPGTTGSTTVTLSTGKATTPEDCDNGIDDDLDGAIDCADLDCGAASTCNLCVPDIDLGTLVRDGASKSTTVDTTTGSDRYHPGCSGMSTGKDVVVQFSVRETALLEIDWRQTGDHGYAISKVPNAGERCDSGSQTGCTYWGADSSGIDYWSFADPGDYLLIFKPRAAGLEGKISLTLSAHANRGVELCDNDIDDDGDRLVDCADPDCYAMSICAAPLCMADGELGSIGIGTTVSLHVDLAGATQVFRADCGKGDGHGRAYRMSLSDPMDLEVRWKQTGDHVLQIARQIGPLDACDADSNKNCASLYLLPSSFAFPELQPGTYYLLVQAFSLGTEGTMDLTLTGASRRILEICDNGIDDDGDGAVDCNDRKCFTDSKCQSLTCKLDKNLGLLPLDGAGLSAALQTAGAGDDQVKTACVVAPGGADAVLGFELPGQTDLTIEWAQVGSHSLALYRADVVPLPCEANAPVQCTATKGLSTGSFQVGGLAAGKYYLVVDADQPGNEGGVVIQISGVSSTR